jgi:hypothetical protein
VAATLSSLAPSILAHNPAPTLNPVTCSGCFGPPVATAGQTSVQVGYADDEPVSGFLPDYVVHELTLDLSGSLTDPGTIALLGSSNEYNGFTGFTRYVISGYATSPTLLPAGLPLFAVGLGALALLGWRRKRTARSIAA